MKKSLPGIFIVLLFMAVAVATGCKKDAEADTSITPVVGTVTLVTDLTSTTATSGGINLYFDPTVSYDVVNGVCWSSINTSPNLADSKTTDSLKTSFTSKITGLTPNTTYYVRAYVTYQSVTGYGNVVKFKTPSATATTTATVSTFAGVPGVIGTADGSGSVARFNGPQFVIYNPASGTLNVADAYNNTIRNLTLAGLANTPTIPTLGYEEGALSSAKFYGIRGIAVDAAGNTYIADVGNNVIRKITAATGIVSTFAGSGLVGYTDGTGTAAKFNAPQSVAVDPTSGNVYVADRGNNLIRKITPAGVVSTLAGGVYGGFADGTGTAAFFNAPAAVAVDASGNIYVADLKNSALRKVSPTGVVVTVGGGSLLSKIIGAPAGLAFDAAGNLFIADQGGRILKYIPDNNSINTIAGSLNTLGFANGIGAAAQFSSPQGLAVDPAGNVYVADFGNNIIRKISITTTP